MTTIFEATATALATLHIPYGMNNYLSTGELPDQYIVYTVVTGVPAQHADNAETKRTYRVQVTIYSRGGLVSIPDVDAAMLAAGFTKGPERQLPGDPETGHYSLAKDYFYLM
ncbi:MAG: hypothetical protein ABSF99_01155 [Anaerolineales bacterium]|jgi:hypothetical protein